ncbi:MAG: hypothetical protein K2O88_08420, partial [Paramuribaculum sp.]|nr:hypothetical protein [Paramuribaculum sp.]
DRDDMHQLISYMYVENADTGIFLYPSDATTERRLIGILRGFGGKVYSLGLHIPNADSMSEFARKMENEEEKFMGTMA